jgi:hypothetical protein
VAGSRVRSGGGVFGDDLAHVWVGGIPNLVWNPFRDSGYVGKVRGVKCCLSFEYWGSMKFAWVSVWMDVGHDRPALERIIGFWPIKIFGLKIVIGRFALVSIPSTMLSPSFSPHFLVAVSPDRQATQPAQRPPNIIG